MSNRRTSLRYGLGLRMYKVSSSSVLCLKPKALPAGVGDNAAAKVSIGVAW